MKIATFGSWIDQSDRGWKSKGSRQDFEETCRQIGSKIAELGHSVIVGSSKRHTADWHVVEGVLSYHSKIGGRPSSTPSIKVIRSADEVDEYGTLSKQWQTHFIFSPRKGFRSDGVKVLAVKEADAVITVGGAGGTYLAGLSAILANKPFAPIASFGGASEQLIGAVRELGGSTDALEILHSPWTPHVLDSACKLAGLVKDPGPDVSVPKKIFVVHGHDEAAQAKVALFLHRIDFEPIILHEQTNQGRAIIEKFEAHSDVGFAVILLTPDDVGAKAGDDPKPRARQNVILEWGYFIGRLGRRHVCVLMSGNVEIPSDTLGVLWEPFDNGREWKTKLAGELQAAGFKIDWDKVSRA